MKQKLESFFLGAASVLVLFPTTASISEESNEALWEKDWERIGSDFKASIEIEQSNQSQLLLVEA